jgi:hypothetical protein
MLKKKERKKEKGANLMNRRVHRIGTDRAFKELMNTSRVKRRSHRISIVIVIIIGGGGGGGGVWL